MRRAASSFRQSQKSLSKLLKRDRSSHSESSNKSSELTTSASSPQLERTLTLQSSRDSPIHASEPNLQYCPPSTPARIKPRGFWSSVGKSLNRFACKIFGRSICHFLCGKKKSYAVAYATPMSAGSSRRKSEELKLPTVPHWMTVSSEKTSMLKWTLLRQAQGVKSKTLKAVGVTRRLSMF
ncbi:unnamed protein product [Bursaphelenchus xylophilus]|uniref:(pine wood nematode) hypothetical protein n=1 Tax=Bursaphelenchus xylophilus TaxID=6326 RepID=A0A7I8X8H0_BURXY|nr:unnamed protein product [Bursaphelenchus xylophilus]CAG9125839.1 unnamed protein product [Bursaphelenchus xylophilus]